MAPYSYSVLEDRGILLISGDDSRQFLQGLISNDVMLVTENNAIYAALLTPQGKYLFDFFIAEHADGLLLRSCGEYRFTRSGMKRHFLAPRQFGIPL